MDVEGKRANVITELKRGLSRLYISTVYRTILVEQGLTIRMYFDAGTTSAAGQLIW
jgi:hypothetical protein